jgi:HSP20 family protein
MAIRIPLVQSEAGDDTLFPEAAHVRSRGSIEEGFWNSHGEEGQLAIDVYETATEIILMTAIAGVTLKQLEVFLHNDMLTVRGKRTAEIDMDARPLVQECHWGSFSRSVILPTEIDAEGIAATMKEGILTVRMPKMERNKRIHVKEA